MMRWALAILFVFAGDGTAVAGKRSLAEQNYEAIDILKGLIGSIEQSLKEVDKQKLFNLRHRDVIRLVETKFEAIQTQENITHVLQSIDRRLTRMESSTEQLLQRVPEGVSFACPPGYVKVSGKCLFLSKSTSNYDGAMKECSQTAGGRLLIIDNCNVLQNIAEYFDNAGVDKFWVGATDLKEEGKWVWSDGRDVQMGAMWWARTLSGTYAVEPSGNAAENCLLMRTDDNFLFGDSDCETESGKLALCQYENDVCSSPRIRLEGRCVEFLNDFQRDWSVAGAKCADNGGHLAKVDDCNFMGAIIAHILDSGLIPRDGYWLGGNDMAKEGTWLWHDGSPITMGTPFWGKDGSSALQPDNSNNIEDCGSVDAQRKWRFNDLPCSQSVVHAACEAPHIVI